MAGVGCDRLLRSSDRAETLILGMVVDRATERQQVQRENEIHMMANEIAKRF